MQGPYIISYKNNWLGYDYDNKIRNTPWLKRRFLELYYSIQTSHLSMPLQIQPQILIGDLEINHYLGTNGFSLRKRLVWLLRETEAESKNFP
jgi:hypothetical protein